MKKKIDRYKIMAEMATLMLAAGMLTACFRGKTEETVVAEETTVAEEISAPESTPAQTEETKEVAVEARTGQESVEESVAGNEDGTEGEETKDEYAGIDMESTLPGVEWIQSFEGIIEEPRLVVFNDETNKKIILEDNQEVEFYDADTLAVYIPKGRGQVEDELLFEEINYYDSVTTIRKMPAAIRRGGYSAATCIDIEFDGKPMTLYCWLKLMG